MKAPFGYCRLLGVMHTYATYIRVCFFCLGFQKTCFYQLQNPVCCRLQLLDKTIPRWYVWKLGLLLRDVQEHGMCATCCWTTHSCCCFVGDCVFGLVNTAVRQSHLCLWTQKWVISLLPLSTHHEGNQLSQSIAGSALAGFISQCPKTTYYSHPRRWFR